VHGCVGMCVHQAKPGQPTQHWLRCCLVYSLLAGWDEFFCLNQTTAWHPPGPLYTHIMPCTDHPLTNPTSPVLLAVSGYQILQALLLILCFDYTI
jgi:hypothetical protein